MVANHPGMSDQTSSNIARDGAAKKVQGKVATKWDTKNLTTLLGIAAAALGPDSAPDGSSPNVLDPTTKSKKTAPIPVKWGMEKSPNTHSPEMGTAVLNEAANLGR